MYTRSGSGWDAVYLQSLADGAVDVVRDDSVSAFSCAQQVSDEFLSGLFACTCRHSGCFSGGKKHLQALADGFFGVVQGDSVSASPCPHQPLSRMPFPMHFLMEFCKQDSCIVCNAIQGSKVPVDICGWLLWCGPG